MRRALAAIGIAVTSLASFTVAGGRPNVVDPRSFGEAFDARAGAPGVRPTKTQISAIVALLREHPDVRMDWNPRFGTPATVLRYGTSLAGPAAGQPSAAARSWLRAHASLFGWRPGDVSALKTVKTLAQPRGGPVIVLLHQLFAGYEGYSFGGSVVVGLDRANRVLSVRANVVRTRSLARGWSLSAADSMRIASGTTALRIAGHRNEWIEFAPGAAPAPHFVRRIAFPMGGGAARPAWEVHVTERFDSRFRTVVDAASGEILYRHQMTQREAPEGRIFQNHPGAKKGGTHEMVSFKGDPTASPDGWLTPSGPATTIGNNAVTATHWITGQAPEGLGQVRPVSANGSFDVAFQNAWNETDCGGSLPVYGPGATPTYALDAQPAVLNLFYHHNVMHDFFYGLGFDENAGAMQLQNFGRGGKENDPLIGMSQSGALILPVNSNNAFMSSDEDGMLSYSGMFLFLPLPGVPFPCVDGDFDSEVIYHEYTHAVSNRWVGAEFGNLDTFQGGSMGEAWGDFYGVHYLHSLGLETTTALGPYATGDAQRGIRNWPLDGVEANYGDLGYDFGPEVHSDGEIWSGVLWGLRTALEKTTRGGANLAAQLIADGMPLSGPHPSMLNMRDGILAADLARTKGKYQSVLWAVFARHGMGFSAKSKDGDDTDAIPGFDAKNKALNATIVGRVVDPVSQSPLPGASVSISKFEQSVSPITRTAADGTFTLRVAAGTQPIKVSLPGYGSQVTNVLAKAGSTVTGVFRIGSNYASSALGAKVIAVTSEASEGNAAAAIDESEASAWTSAAADTAQSITVKLAGTVPVDIAAFRLSALTADRGSSAKAWQLLTSVDGKTFVPAANGGFSAGHLGPAVNDMTFRDIRLARTSKASFVRLDVTAPQAADAGAVTVADLQVFGRGDGFKATPIKPTAFHIESLVAVPIPQAIFPTTNDEPPTTPTAAIFEATCVYPPPTQGLDGFVVELPDGFGDGFHTYRFEAVTATGLIFPDLDAYMYSSDCKRTGQSFASVNPESGPIPPGTKYIVLELWIGDLPNVIFDATNASPVKLAHVGIPKPKPVKVLGRKQLAATGVGSAWPAALGLIGAAGALALALRGPRSRLRRRTTISR